MKIAAITAGAQGIGRGIAYAFGRAGYAISILDTSADAGGETLDKLGELGSTGVFVEGSTGSKAAIDAWLERTAKVLGCPDVLVNNAGIMRRTPFLELSVEDFDRVIGINLRGAFLCSQNVARRMVERQQGGTIINIASTRAFMSEPDTESYTASKGGIIALTHGMAISLGEHNIRVNSISPGWIETADWQFSARAKKPDHSARDRMQHPVGRVGNPEDCPGLPVPDRACELHDRAKHHHRRRHEREDDLRGIAASLPGRRR